MEMSKTTIEQHKQLLANYEAALTKLALPDATLSPRQRKLEITFNQNAILLHKLFFADTVETDRHEAPAELLQQIVLDFGSATKLYEQLWEMVQAARNGWVILAWNLMSLQLQVILIDGHDQHVPFGIMPIAVLDMWEHSYTPDFLADRALYFSWWVARMNWLNPTERLTSLLKS